jgi:5-methylcytosine-specific restriction enzyme subunit McrC
MPSITMREWQSLDPSRDKRLRDLPLNDAGQRMAQLLTSAGTLDVTELRTGLALRSSSYVGRVRLGDVEVTVHPKLRGLKLLRLLRYAYGLRDLRLLEDAAYGSEFQAFQDLLIHQLHAEARDLLARGLYRKYLRRREDLPTPRGRIDLNSFARRVPGSARGLPCMYHPRTEDCLENRVLAAGLRLAAAITPDRSLRAKLQPLLSLLDEHVEPMLLTNQTFEMLDRHSSRLTTAYAPSFTIVKMLFDGCGVSLDNDARDAAFAGFMFDMNRFFQALVSRLLRENLPGVVVRDEYSLKGMMQYAPGQNPRSRRAPQPRPDFVLMRGSKVMAVLDAKYRDLWEHPLPRDMLYQLAIYALSQRSCRSATILYATTRSDARPATINVHDPMSSAQAAAVTLQPVDLDRLAGLLSGADSRENHRATHEYAGELTRIVHHSTWQP